MGLGWKPRTGRRGLTAVALLAGALSLQSAHATVLAPGDFAAPIDQINELDFVDRVEATRDFVINVGGNPFLSGHILDRVVTLQDGTLVFETRIFVDSAPSNVGLNVGARSSFAGFATDVSFVSDAPGTFIPNAGAIRSPITGSDVQFNFGGTDLIGDTSSLPPQLQGTHTLVIATDATRFDLVGLFRAKIGTGANALLSDPIPVWAPVAVPEPATWAMVVAGLGLFSLMTRRRSRQS